MRNPTTFSRPASVALAALALSLTGAAFAQAPGPRLLRPNLDTDRRATLEEPIVLAGEARDPVWTKGGLLADRPAGLWGLAGNLHARAPVWDPSTESWFAWALGALVQVRPDGSLPVILEDLPGHDFDIRAARGLVVYRDPRSDEIVLQRLDGQSERRVLFRGFHFFNPRFSPDGSQVLVSESRPLGGHLWLADVEGGAGRDLGRGEQGSWSGDGQRLVFLKLEHDGHRLTASNVFLREVRTGTERLVARSQQHIALQPRLSPDGRWLAFVDDASKDLMLARLPAEGR